MRRIRKLLATAGLVLMLAFPADAATDLGNGVCDQTGELGVWDGTDTSDQACVTVSEYDAKYPTVLDAPLEVGPAREPDAISHREWFDVALGQRFGAR